MTRDVDGRLRRLTERIDEAERLSPTDATALAAFDDRLVVLRSEYGKQRREKLLRHCVRMAEEVGGLADARTDRTAAERIVRWIHESYDNEETNRDYRVALRMFGKHTAPAGVETDDHGVPKAVSWVSATTSRNYKPQPDPARMLWWDEHVLPMLDACSNTRDRALIAVGWDAGPRSGELRNLAVGDVADHKYGLTISVDGKVGPRSVVLIPSVPYLRSWLAEHPARDDRDAPLWCKLDAPEMPSYQMFLKMLRRPARKADVTHTDLTFTRLRKSSASYLASQGVNQVHLEDHHGWERGSDAAARYIAVFQDATEREIARAHGLDVEADETEAIAPLTCVRCGRETPRTEPLCMWCGQALDPTAIEDLDEAEERRDGALAELPPEKARRLLDIADALDDPEVKNVLLNLG